MAETRRWEVLAPARRVRDLTFERRMASFGSFGLAAETERVRHRLKMPNSRSFIVAICRLWECALSLSVSKSCCVIVLRL